MNKIVAAPSSEESASSRGSVGALNEGSISKPAKPAPLFKTSINDAMELAAKKVGIEGWMAYSWEAVEGGHLIEGEVPDGVYTRGPRKGRPRFCSPGSQHARRVIVADAELQAAAKAYESETGRCWECKGTGNVYAGWSASEGVKHRKCARCEGSGKAVAEATAVGIHSQAT